MLLNGKLLHGRVLNEALFCHSSPAATSKYILTVRTKRGEREEEQKSSGLWIGPGRRIDRGPTERWRQSVAADLDADPIRRSRAVHSARAPLEDGPGLISETSEIELRNKMRTARLYLDGHKTEFKLAMGDVLVMKQVGGDAASARPGRTPQLTGPRRK